MTNDEKRELQEIVDGCNSLAAMFYKMHGYDAGEGFKFYHAHHPMEARMWDMAVVAYEELRATDVEAVLDDLLSEQD